MGKCNFPLGNLIYLSKIASSTKGQVIRATVSFNLSRNNVALQVEIVCCAYYHLLVQQILMLQKVETTSTFCNMKICCARRW